MPANWQLPPGVNRGLWDYLHDPAIAGGYDANLAGCKLFEADERFAFRHFTHPGRLLDLGCGTGRFLLACAERGFHAVGVDLSAEMLKVADIKAKTMHRRVDLVQANLVDLSAFADGTFDWAVCLFSTLGMIQGAALRGRVLDHVYRLLCPGGKFVLHVHNRWFTWHSPSMRWWLIKDCLRRLCACAGAGDHVMPPHQGIAGLTLHLFTRREAIRLLDSAGFRVCEVQPLSLSADGCLPCPALFGGLRAYGYLLAAQKDSSDSNRLA